MEPTCTTLPSQDPYHIPGTATRTQLYVDTRTGDYGIIQVDDDGATPVDEYNGLIKTAIIDRPDQAAAESWISDPDTASLVERITAGDYAAWPCLVNQAGNLMPSDWSLWDVSDWLGHLTVTADMDEDALDAIARDAEHDALIMHVVLSSPCLPALEATRDRLAAEISD